MKRRRALLRLLSFVPLALTIAPAQAIAVIEFLKLDASGQHDALEPLILGYLRVGYKRVPDWARLASEIRRVTLEQGYSYHGLEGVAKEAALRLGMSER